jgi:predicted ester cyclase
MPTKRNERIILRIYEEILNEGNLGLADEVVALTAVDHAPHSLSSLPTSGPRAIKEFLPRFCTAFPDAYWAIDEVIAKGDRMVIRTTVSGSHHDEYLGMRPTGRQFTLTGMDNVCISRGQVVEHWGEFDIASMREQLGVRHRARNSRHAKSKPA